MQAVAIALGGERLAGPKHLLLRSTSCKTVALRADAVLGCRVVVEWKGDVDEFGDGYDPLLGCVWQDIHRHLNYGQLTEAMSKVWTDVRALVGLLEAQAPRAVRVKLAGTPCRGDKLYEIKVAPDTVVRKLKN